MSRICAVNGLYDHLSDSAVPTHDILGSTRTGNALRNPVAYDVIGASRICQTSNAVASSVLTPITGTFGNSVFELLRWMSISSYSLFNGDVALAGRIAHDSSSSPIFRTHKEPKSSRFLKKSATTDVNLCLRSSVTTCKCRWGTKQSQVDMTPDPMVPLIVVRQSCPSVQESSTHGIALCSRRFDRASHPAAHIAWCHHSKALILTCRNRKQPART